MGIFIHVAVSTSVTQDEWTKVYEESLKMADALNLADLESVKIHGISVQCLTKTKEREFNSWRGNPYKGWCADGDYRCLSVSESNGLDRNIDYTPKADAVDPLLALSRSRFGDYKNNPWENDYEDYWNGKTQGEPQHMSLLTIGCMIEDRLKDKAFVHGDISRGQIREAVQMANRILDHPIQEPACCNLQRFFERVDKFPTEEKEKLSAFQGYYLGVKDAAYGEFLRNHFSAGVLDQYWRECFKDMPVDRLGYASVFKEYLMQGFSLEGLCRLSTLEDKDGKDLTEKFVELIMDSELYIPEKNTQDILELNTDDPRPYGVSSLFAQLAFAGARNPRVERYIPLDEIRSVLKAELGGRCDTDAAIDKYLSGKEKAVSLQKANADMFSQSINQMVDAGQKKQDDYDIFNFIGLLFYQTGDTIAPGVLKNIVNFHGYCRGMITRYPDEFEKFSKADTEDQFRYLARRSDVLGIRDKDWEKIYNDLEQGTDFCARYQAAFNIALNDQEIRRMVEAYIVNDDLYHDLETGKLKMVDKEGE